EAGQDRQRGQARGGVTFFDGEIAPQLADGLNARCRTIVAAMARYKDDGADHHAAGPVRFGKLEWLWQGMAHRLDLVLDCPHGNLRVFRRERFQAGRYWLVKPASNATVSFRCPVRSSTFW